MGDLTSCLVSLFLALHTTLLFCDLVGSSARWLWRLAFPDVSDAWVADAVDTICYSSTIDSGNKRR